MRKAFYLVFCLVLIMGVGCAVTNYQLITKDNDGDGIGEEVVNTNGKALIRWEQGIALGDGTNWVSFFSMVDQKANGDRSLSTYPIISSVADGSRFLDTFYCSPDWTGCSVLNADDPEDPSDDPLDYTYKINCKGADFLYYIYDSSRYYGECGRAKLPVQDRLAFLAAGNLIDEYTLGYNLNAGNTSLILDNNAGVRSLVPLLGNVGIRLNTFKQNTMTIDMSNPLLANTFRWMADWNDTYGTGHTQMTMIYNGIVRTTDIGLLSDGLNAKANRL